MFEYDMVRNIYVWRFWFRGRKVQMNLTPAEHFDRLWMMTR